MPPARTQLTRRRLLSALGAGVAGLAGARVVLPALWRTGAVGEPDAETIAFARRCLDDLDHARMVDSHVHLAGTETAVTGCWLNPRMKSQLHPAQRLRYELFMGAAGVDGEEGGDAVYVQRLLERHRAANPQGRLLALAFERFHDDDGRPDPARSAMHVPDAYALGLAQEHPELLAAVSIHPYRGDALDRLDEAAERGAAAVKWLPNAMNIDPASPRCRPFYERLEHLGLPLVTHAGEESALSLAAVQEWGNPLRLRQALDLGVTVVVAHAGSLGHCRDLDAGEGTLEDFDAFLRLFDEDRHERKLLADISGLTFINRCGRPLREMLERTNQHHRLVNGSDYPLCAVDPIVSTRLLAWRGYLDDEDRRLCEKVYAANPLLFDLCVKRSLRVIVDGRESRFAPTVFEGSWLFRRGGARRADAEQAARDAAAREREARHKAAVLHTGRPMRDVADRPGGDDRR